MFTLEWVDDFAAKGLPAGRLDCILANRTPLPCAQLYFGLYFGQLAQRPANDVSDRNWGDVGGVGGLFRMKRLLISTTVPI